MKCMKKENRIFIHFLYPGSFFPEQTCERVETTNLPKTVPSDCFGFYFTQTEYVIDGKEEFAGKTKTLSKTYIIGESILVDDIPDKEGGRDNNILKSNITCNSPNKRGIKTHIGNWQWEDEYRVAISPRLFEFTDPVVYKNFKKK